MSIIRAFSEDETNGDGKSPEKPMGVFPESFPSLKNDVSSNNPNIDHQSESIKMPNATKTLPMVSSSHTEMKTPTLKPRVGGYEVLKPRRLVMSVRRTASRTRKQANSPTNKVSYVHKVDLVTAGKKSARTMDHSLLRSEMRIDDGKDLCKNCKVGKWESVCFISNDGKISAANTSPKGICHFHLCNPPRCSAGPNYNCSMSLPNKKEFHLSIEKASLPQNTNERGDEFHPTQGDLCSNTRSLLREKSATDTFSGDGEVESQTTELFLDDQTAKREDKYIGCCFQATDFVNMVKNSPSLEERQRSAFTLSERRDPKACGLMTPFKCSGHDFCSEHHDDSEVPSVNKQVMCGNLATKDSTFELNSIVQLQLRKPNMERMRQKYLYCLKQQEAERVPLRKQEMMSRKKAGEWMLDSAIGEILRKLAPGREAGVKLIIEAFETIMKRKNSEIEEKGRRSSLKLLRQS
ncbi:hypothetical protein KP509_26G051200 [Ceratopteris richardii]|nr:hypothetical protein KP509_26G051200 [Ceratopteris richardii]